jgi:hypothetical protein
VRDDFLSRWSRRKHEANKEPTPAPVEPTAKPAAAADSAAVGEGGKQAPAELPPLDSLTPESDFSAFMKSEVNPATRRAALKTLFQDPRFNVMDGLDVYIDDYSTPDPLPAGWLEKMRGYAALDDHKVLDPRPEPAEEDPARIAQSPEKAEGEQPLGESPGEAPSDTPDAGSKPAPLGESGSERGT